MTASGRSGLAADAGDEGKLAAAFTRVMEKRYSCRAFLPDPVPDEMVREILGIAQNTASWCNTQPWHAYALTQPNAVARFRSGLLNAHDETAPNWEIAPPERYEKVFQQRRRDTGWALYEAVGVPRGDRAASARQARENFNLFGAPHVVIITCDRQHGTYGIADCGAYVANFLAAATAFGLASVPQAALASRASYVRAALMIPDTEVLFCGVSFGWPDEAHPANGFRTTRAGLDEAVSFIGAGDLSSNQSDQTRGEE